MSQRDDGGPAFPALYGQTNDADGMTLRDYFAAMALQANLINTDYRRQAQEDARAKRFRMGRHHARGA